MYLFGFENLKNGIKCTERFTFVKAKLKDFYAQEILLKVQDTDPVFYLFYSSYFPLFDNFNQECELL